MQVTTKQKAALTEFVNFIHLYVSYLLRTSSRSQNRYFWKMRKGMCWQHLLTNSTGPKPYWQTNRSSPTQEIPRILLNTNVHYHIHKSPPPVPILSKINPVHARIPLLEDPLQYYPPIYALSSKWSFFLRIPHQNPVCTSPLPHTCCMPCPFVFWTWSTEWYLVTSTQHKAPRFVVDSILLTEQKVCAFFNADENLPQPHVKMAAITIIIPCTTAHVLSEWCTYRVQVAELLAVHNQKVN
jgi:hypothetical protein